MTKMTSGYKTKVEMEMEREKKKQENEFRPVPLEWQVERYEKSVNRKQEEYIDQLEQYCADEKKKRQDRSVFPVLFCFLLMRNESVSSMLCSILKVPFYCVNQI